MHSLLFNRHFAPADEPPLQVEKNVMCIELCICTDQAVNQQRSINRLLRRLTKTRQLQQLTCSIKKDTAALSKTHLLPPHVIVSNVIVK